MPHPRNKHAAGYDFEALQVFSPEIKDYVKPNKYGDASIDFANHKAVKALNKALLQMDYGIEHWDIPLGYLIPPVPGRADYIHYLADLLGEKNTIKCLDIGTGANCVYPIIAASQYQWKMVGSEIDVKAVQVAKAIVDANPNLKNNIEIRLQENPDSYFRNIIRREEIFDACLCNPPFHASAEEANSVSLKKFNNLNLQKTQNTDPNFQGQANELWCKGGEERFIRNMIYESADFAKNVGWFTTLVSKKGHLRGINKALKKVGAKEVKVIEMEQGNKKSRFVAWRF